MKSTSFIHVALVAFVVSLVVALTGCSVVSGPGKRIKDGFAASEKAKTASFTGKFMIELPASIGPGGVVLTFQGDADMKGTSTATDDETRFEMTITAADFKQKLLMISIGDTQWETVGGKTIGGPLDLEDVDSDWTRLMDAITADVEDLEESGNANVEGVTLDNFTAMIPNAAVCDRLVPLLAELLDAESEDDAAKPKKACRDGLSGPVRLRIGLDEKDWPRLIGASAKVNLVALLELMGAGDAGAPPEMLGVGAEVSVEARVTQYDQPIDPIKAPRDAKMYKTLREFESASEHLSE